MSENRKDVICEGEYYTIQAGDTLSKIANRYNLTVEQLIKANSQIKNPNKIFVGQLICIPAKVDSTKECAIVLTLSREANVALPAIAGGVVLIQRIDGGNYALTFAATGLPSPKSIGDFDTYIGSITIEGQEYSAVLRETAPFEQEPTWAGTRIISVNPFAFPESTVTILTFDLETSVRSNPILGGTVGECKR
ncbi:hypothetical protein U472_01080 [Orenia metallireducens]|uniref:LysM domain-containing protein n=1 Tax=Orenia metallireducens TaxID=1413210 RepID=A0A1C0ACZ7_9FIRM|nr:LysM peptidoglycan-binding domain-containing protein [Orenia metallireducens]OCL28511.1 hypothetical protein U472_01080 [Orenia metallireducens]